MKTYNKNRLIVSPDILEINADTTVVKGFTIGRFEKQYNDFLLTLTSHSQNKYTYSIHNVDNPKNSDAIYGYYSIKDETVYYSRPIGYGLSLRFSYDTANNNMIVNKLEAAIPFEIGQIWPPGLHLTNIIALDLLVNNNILVMEGAATRIKDKTYCILGPSMVGKTTLMSYLINKTGAKYISEDRFLTNGNDVFLTPPLNYKYFNINTLKEATLRSSSIDSIVTLSKGKFHIQNTDTLLDISSLRVLSCLDNTFIRALQFFGIYKQNVIRQKKNMILERLADKNLNMITINHDDETQNNASKIFGDLQ